MFRIEYLKLDGSQRYTFINPLSSYLVLPSALIVFENGAPATTKFSSVLIESENPNLLVLSLFSVIVTVDCGLNAVPAVAVDRNKKCTSPCPLPGADTTNVLPSFLATICDPKF